jgi:threonyl-tRNA synthetase
MSQNQNIESPKPVDPENSWQNAEAQRRDHRRIGKELELFHFDETAPGMPYWLPKGQRVLNELINFWREQHELRNYQEVSPPFIN